MGLNEDNKMTVIRNEFNTIDFKTMNEANIFAADMLQSLLKSNAKFDKIYPLFLRVIDDPNNAENYVHKLSFVKNDLDSIEIILS